MAIVMLSGSYICMCDVGIVEPRWNETISYIGIFSNDLLFLFSVAIMVPVRCRQHRFHLLTAQLWTGNKRADKKKTFCTFGRTLMSVEIVFSELQDIVIVVVQRFDIQLLLNVFHLLQFFLHSEFSPLITFRRVFDESVVVFPIRTL